MDRNLCHFELKKRTTVALRKESVDRNLSISSCKDCKDASLSARRAWIEIKVCCFSLSWLVVALRKESVDRNLACWCVCEILRLSLSARRAWIEIEAGRKQGACLCVALRKESVDRNTSFTPLFLTTQVALRKESVDRNEWRGAG